MDAADLDTARADAVAQVAAGAQMIDVNAGVPGADEPARVVLVLRIVVAATCPGMDITPPRA